MRDLLLLTAFVLLMAYFQSRSTKRVLRYNNNLTSTQTQKKDNGTYMTIAMIVMMLLAMFRGTKVGSDTQEYREIFTHIITNPDYANVTRYETGYIFLNKLVGKFTTNPQGIILVSSLIYYLVFIWFIRKRCNNYAFALVLFFFIVLNDTVNIIRQELAIAFLLIAIDKIIDRKNFVALIWIVIAFLFHKASIFFVILLIIPHLRYNHIVSLVIVLVAFLLAFTETLYKITLVVAPDYAEYFSGRFSRNGYLTVTYEVMKNLAFLVTVILIREKQSNKGKPVFQNGRLKLDSQHKLLLYSMFIAFIFSIMAYRVFVFLRIVQYLYILNIVLLCNMINQMSNKAYKRNLIALIVIILIAQAVVQKITRPDWNSAFPYEFFWQ